MFKMWIKGTLNAFMVIENIFCPIGWLLHVRDMGIGQLMKFSAFCSVVFNALTSFVIYCWIVTKSLCPKMPPIPKPLTSETLASLQTPPRIRSIFWGDHLVVRGDTPSPRQIDYEVHASHLSLAPCLRLLFIRTSPSDTHCHSETFASDSPFRRLAHFTHLGPVIGSEIPLWNTIPSEASTSDFLSSEPTVSNLSDSLRIHL